jgi:hypothetical protein
MGTEYAIRAAKITDLDTLFDFTTRKARETEGEDPDPGRTRWRSFAERRYRTIFHGQKVFSNHL